MPKRLLIVALLFLTASALTACGQEGNTGSNSATPPAGSPSLATTPPLEPTRTPVELPTLYPTFTRPAPPTTPPTAAPDETATPDTPVDLTTPVLTFRYVIPALDLERSVTANAGGRIVIRDEATGAEVVRNNQLSVVEEMQGALGGLVMEPVPEGCAGCVQLAYTLPQTAETGLGWLRDPVLLASVENYTAANLGPHFPLGTVAGLRRAATPYDPAHSLAVSAEGLLWRWAANVDTVPAPVPVSTFPALAAAVAELPALALEGLADRYAADCPLSPVENLWLNPAGTPTGTTEPSPNSSRALTVVCPAFSLPGLLVPLYVGMDTALTETLAGAGDPLTPPPLELPLDMMLDYQRADGARLTMRLNGVTVGQDPLGATFTTTLPVSNVITLTTGMAATGRLVPGVEQYAAGDVPHLLLVRGPYQMWELGWRELAPPGLRPFIAQLDRQLNQLLGLAPTPTITTTPGTETPLPETPSGTPAGTPTGNSPSPTP